MFTDVTLPVTRVRFAELITHEELTAQPMSAPTTATFRTEYRPYMSTMNDTKFTVIPATADILARLRKNRDAHKAMIDEAREGFLKNAKYELRKQTEAAIADLEEQEKRKTNLQSVSVSIRLSPPSSHVRDYDTVITMLEMHTGETIELSALDMRRFGEDEWDWTDRFLFDNSVYSMSARKRAVERGLV